MAEGEMEEGTDEKGENADRISSEDEVRSKRKSRSKHKKKHKSKSKKRKKRHRKSRSPSSTSSKSPSPSASPKPRCEDEGKSENEEQKSSLVESGKVKENGDHGGAKAKDKVLPERDVESEVKKHPEKSSATSLGDKDGSCPEASPSVGEEKKGGPSLGKASEKKSPGKRRQSRSHSRSSDSISLKRSRSRSYSRHRSQSKRRTRSRSSERHSRKRSHSRETQSRSRKRSHRSRSHSHGRHRQSSPKRRRSSSHSYERKHSQSPRRSRTQRRSQSRSRQRSHSRSRRGSHSRSRRSRSHSRRRSRSRSRENRRNRTPVYSYRRRRSRSRSRGSRRTRSRTRSKSPDKKTPASNGMTLPTPTVTAPTTSTSVIDKPASSEPPSLNRVSGQKSIAELTAFCKKLTEETEEDSEAAAGERDQKEDESLPETTHHPFLVKPAAEIFIPPVLFPPARPLRLDDPSKPLPEQFPVSCGSKHREKEVVEETTVLNPEPVHMSQDAGVFNKAPVEKIDMSALVTRRLEAQRQLSVNPDDLDAKLTLQEIELKLQSWCQSNVKPGQFTGQLVKSLLPSKELQGGHQAWAKKDMFQNLMPLSGGVGMKLMQKMGWQPGQVLGRRGEGYAEPIAVQVKIDRKGLSSNLEKAAPKKSSVLDVQGKHPVSALSEYCSKRKWPLPDFKLVFDHGAPHSRQFLFKVIVKDMVYQPAVVSNNKKQAKAEAAVYALKALGLMPENAQPQY